MNWTNFWSAKGVTLNGDKLRPGNGFLPPFTAERAADIGVAEEYAYQDGDELPESVDLEEEVVLAE